MKTGIYELDPREYHAHPALSQSRAKTLLEPGGLARFRWREQHPTHPTTAMEEGSIIHKLILGKGDEVIGVGADSWRSKDAQEQRYLAHRRGQIPVLSARFDELVRIAGNALANRQVTELVVGAATEQAMFWQHESGVDLRGMADIMRPGVIADIKTTCTTDPERFAGDAFKLGYAMQAAWYLAGAKALGHDAREFVHIVVETTPPYLCYVAQLDDDFLRIGREQMERAISLYRTACESGEWPGYPHERQLLAPPYWALDDDMEI